MKQHITKLTELQATLLLSGLISLVLIVLSTIGLFFEQPGWIIGVSAGALVALLNVYLTNVTSDLILSGSKTGLFLLGYFARMLSFVVPLIVLVLLQFKGHVPAFTNSFWGYVIGFAPSTLVTVVSQLKFNKESKGEK